MKILTKSNYITSIQCAKKAYFDKNNPIKSELNRHIVEGFQVEEYAETLFPNAIKAPNSQTEGLLKTQELISENVDAILQPSVQSNGMYAKADAICKNSDGWSLYEFKSGTKVDRYIQDITFQFNVFKSSGINITQTFLILVNKDYTKEDSIVPSEYLNIVDVTESVLNKSGEELSNAYNSLRVINQFNEPEVLIHRQCNFNKPGEACPYISRCYTQINDDNVLFIPRINKKKLERLHELNINTLDDINLEDPQIELTEIQSKYVESFQCKEPIIDFFKLDSLIQEIENNNIISFLDFETYQSAIPFKNSKPFQQHPFQFSSISIGENFYSNNDYINTQFERNDERLLIKLIDSIPKEGNIIVWNKSTEKGILTKLATENPKYSFELDSIINRLVDLQTIFQTGGYMDYRLKGSYSLKNVLPLLTDSSYHELKVANGLEAQNVWKKMTQESDLLKKQTMIVDLLNYCSTDVTSMIAIYNALKEIHNLES